LELAEGVFEVKSTNGDTHLGGDDFDARIMEWLVAEFKRDRASICPGPMALQRLKEPPRRRDGAVDRHADGDQSPFITADQSGPKHLNITLTRAKLEQLVDDLVKRTLPPMEQALKDAGLKPTEIDEVILVGGQTACPRCRRSSRRSSARTPTRA